MKNRPAKSRYGERYGHLVVLPVEPERRVSPSGQRFSYMTVRCDCGVEFKTYLGRLTCSKIKSCGCGLGSAEANRKTAERNTTHGLSKTRTYRIWKGVVSRCVIPSATNYKHYGGRGISVCERWREFENFLTDMGECPPGLTIERVDVDGAYEPNNCVWATREEQALNRRNNRVVLLCGKEMTLSQAVGLLGVSRSRVYKLIDRGLTYNEAVEFLRNQRAQDIHSAD